MTCPVFCMKMSKFSQNRFFWHWDFGRMVVELDWENWVDNEWLEIFGEIEPMIIVGVLVHEKFG